MRPDTLVDRRLVFLDSWRLPPTQPTMAYDVVTRTALLSGAIIAQRKAQGAFCFGSSEPYIASGEPNLSLLLEVCHGELEGIAVGPGAIRGLGASSLHQFDTGHKLREVTCLSDLH